MTPSAPGDIGSPTFFVVFASAVVFAVFIVSAYTLLVSAYAFVDSAFVDSVFAFLVSSFACNEIATPDFLSTYQGC